jgi:hypothetical protein
MLRRRGQSPLLWDEPWPADLPMTSMLVNTLKPREKPIYVPETRAQVFVITALAVEL